MKKFLNKIVPNSDYIKNHKYLSKFKLDNPKLWNFNRKSIRKGVAIGLFCTFLPIPMQMFVASIFAIIFAGNILISIALVWITNPLTMLPIFYILYKIGCWVLGIEVTMEFEFSIEFINNAFIIIWRPLLVGSLIVSSISAIFGYYLINIIYWWKFKQRINN